MRSERGQASVEWVALVLLVALALAALLVLAPRVDGRSLGGLVAGRITCAARESCVRTPVRTRPRAVPLSLPGAPPPARPRRAGSLAPDLLKRAARRFVSINGLICYLRKSTAKGDRNDFRDDIGDAINCLNPVRDLTGDVGGTDGR